MDICFYRRTQRSQSVQPMMSAQTQSTQAPALHGKANFQAKRFNTQVRSPRSERSQSVTRYFNFVKRKDFTTRHRVSLTLIVQTF